jgi:hypothetical protein
MKSYNHKQNLDIVMLLILIMLSIVPLYKYIMSL